MDDSDSGSDTESYTTTNVLLGYASKEPTDDTISQLGGKPTWLDPSKPPSAAFAKCKVCQALMPLLLQLHADLPERFPGHERRLHIFACKNKACRRKAGTVRVLRTTRITSAPAKQQQQQEKPAQAAAQPQRNLGNDIFGGTRSAGSSANENPFALGSPLSTNDTNPFSVSNVAANPFAPNPDPAPQSSPTAQPAAPTPSTTADSNLASTFAAKARLSPVPSLAQPPAATAAGEAWPATIPAYPHYHLDADYEAIDAPPAATIPSNATQQPTQPMDIEGGPTSSSKAEKEAADAFESSHDRVFQRFADRVGQNPEQVLRYEFAGAPLLYSDADEVGARLAPRQHGAGAEGLPAEVGSIGDVLAGSGGSGSGAARGEAEAKIALRARVGQSGVPGCARCGKGRVFELQLTPQAIVEMEAEDEGIDGMEWGTVIVGVCEADCGEEGRVVEIEEWAGVQWEEVKEKGR